MVSVLPCKVTVTFFILLSNEIVCSKSLVRSDMKCILYVIASLFLNLCLHCTSVLSFA